MPKARREHGLRVMEAARKALAARTAAGSDPRRSAAVNRVRSEAISERHRRRDARKLLVLAYGILRSGVAFDANYT
jgi:hypothetical protein